MGYKFTELSLDGVNTSNVTVTAETMLAGITAHNASGKKITGTIPTYDGAVTGGLEVVVEPTMYLYGHEAEKTVSYNGVVLPDIDTVWTDKETYPYAFVLVEEVGKSLLISSVPLYHNDKGIYATNSGMVKMFVNPDTQETSALFGVEIGEWGFYIGSDSMPEDGYIFSVGVNTTNFWSNYDILNADGTLYLSASDPVYTYENADVTIDGVGYVGAVLPALPFLDTYPYVFIEMKADGIDFTAYCSASPLHISGSDPLLIKDHPCAYYHYDSAEDTDWRQGIVNDTWGGTYLKYISTPLWSNNDIRNTDGTLYIDATEPVPVCGEPIAHSYNGVELPALPEWDKESCPYAIIRYVEIDGVKTAQIVRSTNPFGYCNAKDGLGMIGMLYNETSVLGINAMTCDFYVFNCPTNGESVWVQEQIVDNIRTYGTDDLVWVNHDIKNTEDGTIFLSASEPVPVYE